MAQYTYNNDAKKLISAVNYANGQSISYNYNDNGNISSLYYGDTLAYTYLYNSENTLTAKINRIDNVRTDYTGSNALVSDINADGTLTERYSYAFARLNKVKQPAGTIADDEFDAVPDGEEAELERITESFGGETYFTDYYDGYLKYGNITRTEEKTENTLNKTEIKNGRNVIISSEYEYNDNGIPVKLIQRFGGLKKTYNYTYGTDGNITAVTEEADYNYSDDSCELPPVGFDGDTTETGSKETRYYYDNRGQLIRTDDEKEDKTSVYEYDGNGNITAVKTYALHAKDAALGAPVSVKTFGYNAGDWTDLLTSVDGNTVTYDALGNMLMYNGYTYIWQAGRRLAGMTDGTNTYSYKYDDSGIRTEKTVNGVTTHYTTVDGRITGQYDGTNTLYFRYDADNSPIGFNLNGTEYVYFKNIQGDIEEILDISGNSVVKYAYNEWGSVLSVTGSMAVAVGQINPIRYRGYYYDGETGYYYLQSRYYNPDICRFINADEPEILLLSLEKSNLYIYGNNNPIVTNDPTGHVTIYIFGAAISLGSVIALLCLTVFIVAYYTNPDFRNGVNDMFYYVARSMVDGTRYIATVISDAIASAKKGRRYWGNELHHIVAKSDYRASSSRRILSRYKISVNSSYNLVSLKKTLHRHVHTNSYHAAVYIVIRSLEGKSGSYNTKKNRVIGALIFISAVLSAANRYI